MSAYLDDLSSRLVAGDLSGLRALFAEAGLPSPEVVFAPEPDALPAEPLRFLLRYWLSLPRPCGLPSVNDIDAFNLRPALGFATVLDVIDAGRDFRYRVFGSKLANRLPFDLTGRRVSDNPSPAMARFFIAVHQAAIARRAPVYTRHVPPRTIEVEFWDRISLPFVDDDGVVQRMLAGNVAGDWRKAKLGDEHDDG